MTTTASGWPASRDPNAINVGSFIIAGRSFPGGVRMGAPTTVLKYVVAQYHLRVESLYYGDTDRDDWGWSYRRIGGSSRLSEHSGGVAVDVNATTNPQGSRNTHTYAQEQTIHRILREAYGAVIWGGDWDRSPDGMHFQLVPYAEREKVYAAAKKLQSPPWFKRDLYVTGTDPAKWISGEDVKVVQRRLGFTGTGVDGRYGPATRDAVKKMEGRLLLVKTGKVSKSRAFFVGTSA